MLSPLWLVPLRPPILMGPWGHGDGAMLSPLWLVPLRPPHPDGTTGTRGWAMAPSLRLKSLAAEDSFSTCLTKIPWSPPPATM